VWYLLLFWCIIPKQGVDGCSIIGGLEYLFINCAKSIKLLENALKLRGYASSQVWEAVES